MRAEEPSVTAQRVAMHRAAHQILDQPRVFDDPLAVAVIGKEAERTLSSGLERLEAAGSRHIRAFMAARNRFAEDRLAEAMEAGAEQYVVLGAGLDTYAYRNRWGRAKVFEVDHPATQAWKRRRLEAAGIEAPESLQFVPVDFEQQSLREALEGAEFRREAISFFSWLGVTQYLTAEAAMATLGFIGSMPQGSGVVFDYAVERERLGEDERLAMDALASRVARAGEPFRLFIDPRALAAMLRAAGFRSMEDLGPEAIDGMYFDGRSDGLRVSAGLAHLVHARV